MQIADQDSVDQSNRRADHDDADNRASDGPFQPVDQSQGDEVAEREVGPDAQVYAAGEDHESHSDADERHFAELPDVVAEALERIEPRDLNAEHNNRQQ